MSVLRKQLFTLKNVKTVRLSLSLALVSLAVSSTAFSQSAQPAVNTGQASVGTQLQPSETGAPAEQSDEAAVKNAAQNPVAPAIDLPFQNNTDYGVGPYSRAENVFLVEPVIPIKFSDKWVIITRTLVPIISVPRLSPTDGAVYGLGNIQPQFYFTSTHPGKFIWGAGPQLWLPTATDHAVGVNKMGGGPAFVGVVMQGHWVVGTLLNNQFAGANHAHVDELTFNPFVYYNITRGWYVISAPIITADWTASRSERWSVPVGGGVGRIFTIGKQPLNARTQFFDYAKTPTGGPDWRLQAQLQFIFLVRKH